MEEYFIERIIDLPHSTKINVKDLGILNDFFHKHFCRL